MATHEQTLTSDAHMELIRDLQRRVEDLDNQGRRHNICVRGNLESVLPGQLKSAVLSIFNGLLEQQPDSPIVIERYHRALRLRGNQADPPRYAVCCVVNFQLKEELLQRARDREPVQYGEVTIQRF